MVTSKVGPTVTGEDFFDREREQHQIWDSLHGNDLLLLAPRRVGKTSLMLRLRDSAAERSAEAAYLSVADVESEAAFVEKLFHVVAELPSARQVLEGLREGKLGGLFRRIKKVEVLKVFSLDLAEVPAATEERWAVLGEALVEALEREQGRRLLLVDEVPVFVLSLLRQDPTGDRARRFLSWFRTLRQHPDRIGRLRWLLAGSIGLDTVAARLRLGDTINDLYLTHLGPFETETADRLLQELARTYDFPLPEEVCEHVLRRIGWLIPYYVQLLFRELRLHCSERGEGPSSGDVDQVFEDLLGPTKRAYFDYWHQRLDHELGRPDAAFAVSLLNATAADPEGATRSTLGAVLGEQVRDPAARDERLRFLLDVLERDGYLVEAGKRFRFRSPLLREFWLRRVTP